MVRLGSVNLVVDDIKASERFYVDLLGLTVDAERSHPPCFLLLRTANSMLILQNRQDSMGTAKSPSAVELGFELEDVQTVRERLGNRAIVQQMGWGEAIETTDPDGTRLNLYCLSEEETE